MNEEIIPILYAQDAHASAKWYRRLGFEVEGEHQFSPDLPYYLFLACDGNRLHLSEHQGDAKPGTLLYFFVDEVDSIAAEFQAEIIEQPWAREVHLTDPAGNRLRIGERKASR
tara:strand:- start:238 stop:576 length:339 start_codon:yes stop_codon:yes gene_type:complete